jgi:hypothetical protein
MDLKIDSQSRMLWESNIMCFTDASTEPKLTANTSNDCHLIQSYYQPLQITLYT